MEEITETLYTTQYDKIKGKNKGDNKNLTIAVMLLPSGEQPLSSIKSRTMLSYCCL